MPEPIFMDEPPGDDGDSGDELRALLLRLAGGGPAAKQAAARLYDSYAPRFRGHLSLHRLAPEHIEEVIQDVFTRLLAARGLDKVRKPEKYLWQVLRNAFNDHLRRIRKLRERHVDPPAHAQDEPGEAEPRDWLELLMASEGAGPELAAHHDCLARVLELFAREEPERAQVIFLAAIEGLDGHELAEVLGRTYAATREYLSQSRRSLRARADKSCGGFHA